MANKERISIITPAFNAVKTIRETLESVRIQGENVFEYIVVDAMSTDGTSEIISEHTDIVTTHIRESDKGIYDGMNKGIEKSKGDIIGIINSDDILVEGALSHVRKKFSENNIDYLISDVETITEDGIPHGKIFADPKWLDGHKSLLGRDWRFNMVFPHPGLFIKRSVYEELGFYSLDFQLCADHEFLARMLTSNKRGLHIGTPSLASFRLGGRSSSNMESCIIEDKKIAIKYGMNPILAHFICMRKILWIRNNAHKFTS